MQATTSGVMPWLALLLRVGVGMVLIVAGVGKLFDSTAAIRATEGLLRTSGPLVTALALGVSLLEVLLGVHLVAGLNLRFAAPAAVALCAALLLVVIGLWATGYTGNCGCFGIFGGGSPGPEETARDAALLLAALGAWATHRHGPAVDRLSGR